MIDAFEAARVQANESGNASEVQAREAALETAKNRVLDAVAAAYITTRKQIKDHEKAGGAQYKLSDVITDMDTLDLIYNANIYQGQAFTRAGLLIDTYEKHRRAYIAKEKEVTGNDERIAKLIGIAKPRQQTQRAPKAPDVIQSRGADAVAQAAKQREARRADLTRPQKIKQLKTQIEQTEQKIKALQQSKRKWAADLKELEQDEAKHQTNKKQREPEPAPAPPSASARNQ